MLIILNSEIQSVSLFQRIFFVFDFYYHDQQTFNNNRHEVFAYVREQKKTHLNKKLR